MNLQEGQLLKLPQTLDDVTPLPGGIKPEDVIAMSVASKPTETLVRLKVLVKRGEEEKPETIIIAATKGIIEDLYKRVDEEVAARKSA